MIGVDFRQLEQQFETFSNKKNGINDLCFLVHHLLYGSGSAHQSKSK
jgi:hypothetical protein